MARFGAVFDWDGVICDTGAMHKRSWELLAEEIGRDFTDAMFKESFGMRNVNIIPELWDWSHDPAEIQRLSDRKEFLFREILRADKIEPLAGVRTFLEGLKSAGIPCVVGSSTVRENIACAVDVMGLRAYFTDFVCSEDVSRGKPHPDVFLTGAERIGVPAARCVVFEDAHVGIEAAKAAGMRVVALTTTHPRATLQDADKVLDRLDEITPDDLLPWFDGKG